jgi:hypothetical protein
MINRTYAILQSPILLAISNHQAMQPQNRISTPTEKKKNDFEARFKKSFKGKSPAPDLRKPADKSQSQS